MSTPNEFMILDDPPFLNPATYDELELNVVWSWFSDECENKLIDERKTRIGGKIHEKRNKK